MTACSTRTPLPKSASECYLICLPRAFQLRSM
jgi:hypothetical protein